MVICFYFHIFMYRVFEPRSANMFWVFEPKNVFWVSTSFFLATNDAGVRAIFAAHKVAVTHMPWWRQAWAQPRQGARIVRSRNINYIEK